MKIELTLKTTINFNFDMATDYLREVRIWYDQLFPRLTHLLVSNWKGIFESFGENNHLIGYYV